MKKHILPLPLLLLLTTHPATARLGETRAECEKRYGQPVGTTPRNGNPIYLKGGHQIIVGYHKDKAIFISFNKPDPSTEATDLPISGTDGAPLPAAEMTTLLQANAGTHKWTRQAESEDFDIAWDLSDGKTRATYHLRCLHIEDQPATREWNAQAMTIRAAGIPSLGDSRAAVEKRCGKPVETYDSGDVEYQKSGFTIIVTYWRGKAGRLSFKSAELRKDPAHPRERIPAPLSSEEIQAIHKASAGDSEWEEDENEEDFWSRTDRQAHSVYNRDYFSLSIVDEDYYEDSRATEQKETAERLKDFGALGMTRAECDKLLGKPIQDPAEGPVGYHKSGFAILVTFWKGKAAQLIFAKIAADDPDPDAEAREAIPSIECEAILDANSDGKKWIDGDEAANGNITYLRSDQQAAARHEEEEKTLFLYDYAYLAHLQGNPDPDDQNPADSKTTPPHDPSTEALEGF